MSPTQEVADEIRAVTVRLHALLDQVAEGLAQVDEKAQRLLELANEGDTDE